MADRTISVEDEPYAASVEIAKLRAQIDELRPWAPQGTRATFDDVRRQARRLLGRIVAYEFGRWPK